uniref:Uncharacterized protein n=1 Tax=viral metagenome TaxID=1070528 RepID=A0A6M3X6W1_9ZZZZ
MKATRTNYKSFLKKNADSLFFRNLSSFDGRIDCVAERKTDWIKVKNPDDLLNNKLGWLVNRGRDYFSFIENGIEVYNCCGSFQVVNKI